MGSRGIALLFYDHGTRRGWGVSVTHRPLFTPGKDPVRIVQEAGWTPGPVWTSAENLAPTGIRSPDRPARSQSLYRLSYPAHSMQCACAILSYVTCPTLQYFSTLFHSLHYFLKIVIWYKICVSSFSMTFVQSILHSKKNWARYDTECILVFMESTLYFYPILMTLEFSYRCFQK